MLLGIFILFLVIGLAVGAFISVGVTGDTDPFNIGVHINSNMSSETAIVLICAIAFAFFGFCIITA